MTDRIKKHVDNEMRSHPTLYIVLSLLIPLVIFIISCVGLHIVPFGAKHSLAISDAQNYLNGEIALARLISGKGNLLYSLQNGLGKNAWSSFAWGSFAPASLLALFATQETIPVWFTWICAANLSLCGLTMYLLLAGLRGHRLDNLIFSTSYALMGFTVANCYQVGFFHGVQLLPLMALGLVRLLRGKAPWLYILSLGLCAFMNFYFAFHLCVASVVIALAYVYVNGAALRGRLRGLFGRYAVASLIAGFLGAAMWLPALKAYSGGGRLDQTGLGELTFKENMPFLQMFSKLFTGANSTNELVTGMPNIFCGILVVALVILYFIDKNNDVRRRRAAAAVLGLYAISFYIPAFTILMHGGTHTNWFPYRYSYVFSFFMICLAAEEFGRIDALSLRDVKRCGGLLLVAALIVFGTSYEFISGGSVLIDLGLLLMMWVGFWFYKARPEKAPLRVLCLWLLLLVCVNQYANFVISTYKVQDWELDLEQYGKNVMVTGSLVDGIKLSESGFFRMEKDESESGSVAADAALYDYYGVGHSGPTERDFVHKGLCRLGVNWFDMRHWYSEGIPAATDALLGLKYLISENDLDETKGYERLVTLEDKTVFRSAGFLSPAILADAGTHDLELGADVFDNLNGVWKSMTGGMDDVFAPQPDVTYRMHSDYTEQAVTSAELRESVAKAEAEAEKDEADRAEAEPATYIEYSLTAPADGALYYFDTSIPDSANGLIEPAIHCCGVYRAGEAVTGKIPLEASIGSGELLRGYCANLTFATENLDVLSEYAALLNARDITFNVEHENRLTGTFTAEAGRRMLFTLPWDEGWTCSIDGQEAPIEKTWDLFMSVEVPEGAHTWEMKFFPAWMDYGLYLSGAAMAGLLVFVIAWYARRKKESPVPVNEPLPESGVAE